MALKIIGAGFGRTGTSSLQTALEILGYVPCYHMRNYLKMPEHIPLWNDLLTGQMTDWDVIFKDYQATVDWPSTYFWQELADRYPEAKIILTVRDAEAWYMSMQNTIYPVCIKPLPECTEARARHQFIRQMIRYNTFNDRMEDKAYTIKVYEEHNRTIQCLVESNRLLVYEISEGWPPLCDFLACSMPNEPFPHLNNRSEFQTMITQLEKNSIL